MLPTELILVRVQCDGTRASVARLTLAAGDGGDLTLDAPGVRDLEAALVAVGQASRCRVLVLGATAGGFCRGLNLEAALTSDGPARAAAVAGYAACLRRLRRLPVPVLCFVDGPAAGGGVALAAAADVLVATRRSTFSLPEVGLGLVPSLVLPVLRDRLTPQKVRRLALCGLAADAAQALDLGLADQVVDDGPALAATQRRLLRHVLRLHPQAVARARRHGERIASLDFDQALQAGVARTTADLDDPAVTAALRAGAGGDLPPWFERWRPA